MVSAMGLQAMQSVLVLYTALVATITNQVGSIASCFDRVHLAAARPSFLEARLSLPAWSSSNFTSFDHTNDGMQLPLRVGNGGLMQIGHTGADATAFAATMVQFTASLVQPLGMRAAGEIRVVFERVKRKHMMNEAATKFLTNATMAIPKYLKKATTAILIIPYVEGSHAEKGGQGFDESLKLLLRAGDNGLHSRKLLPGFIKELEAASTVTTTNKVMVKPGTTTSLSASFEGVWDKGTIEGNTLQWPSGARTRIDIVSPVELKVSYGGSLYLGKLEHDGKLHWNDGSIWLRRVTTSPVAMATIPVASTKQANPTKVTKVLSPTVKTTTSFSTTVKATTHPRVITTTKAPMAARAELDLTAALAASADLDSARGVVIFPSAGISQERCSETVYATLSTPIRLPGGLISVTKSGVLEQVYNVNSTFVQSAALSLTSFPISGQFTKDVGKVGAIMTGIASRPTLYVKVGAMLTGMVVIVGLIVAARKSGICGSQKMSYSTLKLQSRIERHEAHAEQVFEPTVEELIKSRASLNEVRSWRMRVSIILYLFYVGLCCYTARYGYVAMTCYHGMTWKEYAPFFLLFLCIKCWEIYLFVYSPSTKGSLSLTKFLIRFVSSMFGYFDGYTDAIALNIARACYSLLYPYMVGAFILGVVIVQWLVLAVLSLLLDSSGKCFYKVLHMDAAASCIEFNKTDKYAETLWKAINWSRFVLEDLPQMILQGLFVIHVPKNLIMILSICTSLGSSLFSAYTVASSAISYSAVEVDKMKAVNEVMSLKRNAAEPWEFQDAIARAKALGVPDEDIQPIQEILEPKPWTHGCEFKVGDAIILQVATDWYPQADDGEDIALNFCDKAGNLILHWALVFHDQKMIRNDFSRLKVWDREAMSWGNEDASTIPYGVDMGRAFEVIFQREPDHWRISLNGRHDPSYDFPSFDRNDRGEIFQERNSRDEFFNQGCSKDIVRVHCPQTEFIQILLVPGLKRLE